MMATRDYRLQIATAGAAQITGNVDITAGTLSSADLPLADVPSVSAGHIRPLEGDVDPVSFGVDVIDESAIFTGHLVDSGGRLDLLVRRARWQVSPDGGTSWSTLFVGRIDGVTQQDPTLYRVNVTNERMRASEITVFTADDLSDASFPFEATTTVYPAGIRPDREPIYKLAPHTPIGKFEIVGTSPTKLRAVGGSGIQVVEAMEEAGRVLTEDVVEDPVWGTGNFEHARFRELDMSTDPPGGTDHEIEGFGSATGRVSGETANPMAAVDSDPQMVREPIVTSALGTVGDVVRGFIYMPTKPPSREVPIHIGVQGGSLQVDPLWVVKELYDFYGLSYDSTAFSAWDATTNPRGLLDHPNIRGLADFRLRLTDTMTLRELTRRIYRMFGLVPLQVEGNERPVRVSMPSHATLSNPTTAFALRAESSGSNEANVAGDMPDWRHATDTHKTRVTARWTQEVNADRLLQEFGDDLPRTDRAPFRFEGAGRPRALDKIVTAEHTETHDHDRIDQFGVREHEVEMLGVHDTASAKAATEALSVEVLHRYGDGAPMIEVPTVPTATDASGVSPEDQSPGDFVRVIHEALPNPTTGDRTGEQLAQILDKTEGFGELRLFLLYAGPASQPSNVPTLSLTKDASNPKQGVVASISNLPASADSWPLWLAVSDTQPAHGSEKWYMARRPDASTSSVTIGGLPSGNTIWARAQAWEGLTVRSDFTAIQSVTLDGLPAPSSVTADEVVGDFARFSFVAGDTSLKTEFRLDRGNEAGRPSGLKREAILPPGLQLAFISGLALSTQYTAGFRHIDPEGLEAGVSSESTVTFTTTSTRDNPDEPDPDGDSTDEFPGNPGVPKPPLQPATAPAFPQ